MQAGELLASLVKFDSARHLLLLGSLLLHLDGIIGKVTESGVTIEGAIGLRGNGCATSRAPHESAHLILQSVVFLLQLVVLFFYPQMVLDLLSLIVMANLHLMTSHILHFFLQSLLLVSKSLQSQHNLLNLILSLLQHLFLLTVFTI